MKVDRKNLPEVVTGNIVHNFGRTWVREGDVWVCEDPRGCKKELTKSMLINDLVYDYLIPVPKDESRDGI